MPSEHLASGKTNLKGDLASAWNILEGASANYTDLGIARRFGGAAAAYSLRDVGAMNGRVVKVRRDADGQGSDPEEDFSANQVQSGALEDWVNGKLENTLPADVATAAAAYSLRKVKADYSDDVVRIRRSSDSVEVDVAFDSDDKVSLSSAVTNVAEQGGESGSTSATTLGGFLTETANMYTSNFASTDGFSGNQGSVASVDGIGGKDDVLGFTLNTATSSFHMAFKNIGTSDETVRVQGEVYIPSSNNKVDSVAIFIDGGGSTTQIGSTLVPTADQWVAFDVTGQVSGTKIHFRAKDGGTFTIQDTGGDDVFYLANVTVNATQSSAFVHTWYDQAGSNDAVQDTSGDQPKIAENGALITNNSKPAISFADDGVRLSATRFLTSQGNTYFAVYDVTNSLYPSDAGTVIRQGTNFRIGMNVLGGADAGKIRTQVRDSGDDKARADTAASFDGQTILQTGIISATRGAGGVKTFVNSANETSADSTDVQDVDFTTVENPNSSNNALYIGSNNLGNFDFLGNLQEIILFNTDESDNRFKIESNINNYYSLYTAQYDGFVETWYDQSGNGNNATQSTAGNQPKIVSSGSIVTESQGKPAIDMINGTVTKFAMGSEVSMQSMFAVCSVTDVGGTAQCLLNKAGTNNKHFRFRGSGANFDPEAKLVSQLAVGTDISEDVGNIVEYNRDDSNDNTIFVNGTQQTLTTNTITADIPTDTIGTRVSTNDPYAGKIQEIIMFEVDKSADREDLRNDINNHYNIY